MALAFCRQPQKMATGERGQAILEIIPVIMLLLVLTFGVIDFSRAIWQLEVLTGLTRECSNLASRNTTLANSAAAVISDGAVLNLSNKGKVIITSVTNSGSSGSPKFVMTAQYFSTGGISATSKLGTYNANAHGSKANVVTLPNESSASPIPQPGTTVYITEIFNSYSPITPLGIFVKLTMPQTLYDVAYF
jgi:Flp pilus assembly protein TadG